MFRWHRVLGSTLVLAVCSGPVHAENARQLTFGAPGDQDAWAVFSPRGDKVAFGRVPSGAGLLQTVLVADVSTGAVDSLVTGLPAGWNPNGGLDWSPDGRQIAFMGPAEGGGTAVWIADVPSPPPPPLPHLVAALEGDAMGSCGTLVAIDDRGTLYVDCGVTGNWQVAGSVAGRPVQLTTGPHPRRILVAMTNGDVWASEGGNTLPWTFTLLSNVFASAGVSAVEGMAPTAAGRSDVARPNPFNPTTRIPYTLASAGRITARVYDAAGRLVRTLEDGEKQSGTHTAVWNGDTDAGSKAASGTYFLTIKYPDGTVAEQKLTVLK